jgi:hypothetical protein
MKQVFQANDGTIFEKEIDCEKYESKVAYRESLEEAIRQEWTEQDVTIGINIITKLVHKRHAGKLINFIKSIGEQDANNSN